MIDKLTTVTIVVKDQNNALGFYTGVLGLEKRTDFTGPGGVRYVTVAPRGQDIEINLFKAGPWPDPKGGEVQLKPPNDAQWSFQSTDCKKDFEELKARGVKFEQDKPAEFPWGIQAQFTDPDGNRFVLLQPAAKQAW
jgi:predicted enzyme related to lactoylglutathione lyase